ncbi:MAG: cytochrome bc complex cytochrome b subunit [Candidatus Omnitrophica bacterium]|nr:cytochrome bc complex cytochrome b subunit [Candidatus Omnitrophota bacterium]MDE2008846.1 cytochrome bc complex cytochrome b subunit [Candidatus Omnitrophota bacterium]MDE2213591.1 cytochrome bc complex cytochrome b subunit [Candidatus Omnitrophota bacterium]MDE2230508.1 cytochrome bc complex cytochrome b subunit [Candidatus Omnitrophota bacterium]
MLGQKKWLSRMVEFMNDRLPMHKFDFEHLVLKKEVPVHRMSWAYYLGGLTLFFFLVQVVTGVFLLFYYQPTVSDAHASIEYINKYVSEGFFIRNLHAWSSSCMILCLVAHAVTTFAMKAFAPPREIIWVGGVIMLLLGFAFGFTGYLLPWHQIAVNATKVMLQTIERSGRYLPGPLSGAPHYIKELIQGGPVIGQATLSRFYALHVVILPLIFVAILGIHLLSVQLHGMSQGVDKPAKKSEKFFPFFVLKDLIVWGIAFFLVFVLAECVPFESFSPFPLFQPFNALGATPEGIRPEWYFYFAYYPLELLPFWLVLIGMTVTIVVLFLASWIFKNTQRRVLGVMAWVITAYLVIITLFGSVIYEIVKGVKP